MEEGKDESNPLLTRKARLVTRKQMKDSDSVVTFTSIESSLARKKKKNKSKLSKSSASTSRGMDAGPSKKNSMDEPDRPMSSKKKSKLSVNEQVRNNLGISQPMEADPSASPTSDFMVLNKAEAQGTILSQESTDILGPKKSAEDIRKQWMWLNSQDSNVGNMSEASTDRFGKTANRKLSKASDSEQVGQSSVASLSSHQPTIIDKLLSRWKEDETPATSSSKVSKGRKSKPNALATKSKGSLVGSYAGRPVSDVQRNSVNGINGSKPESHVQNKRDGAKNSALAPSADDGRRSNEESEEAEDTDEVDSQVALTISSWETRLKNYQQTKLDETDSTGTSDDSVFEIPDSSPIRFSSGETTKKTGENHGKQIREDLSNAGSEVIFNVSQILDTPIETVSNREIKRRRRYRPSGGKLLPREEVEEDSDDVDVVSFDLPSVQPNPLACTRFFFIPDAVQGDIMTEIFKLGLNERILLMDKSLPISARYEQSTMIIVSPGVPMYYMVEAICRVMFIYNSDDSPIIAVKRDNHVKFHQHALAVQYAARDSIRRQEERTKFAQKQNRMRFLPLPEYVKKSRECNLVLMWNMELPGWSMILSKGRAEMVESFTYNA